MVTPRSLRTDCGMRCGYLMHWEGEGAGKQPHQRLAVQEPPVHLVLGVLRIAKIEELHEPEAARGPRVVVAGEVDVLDFSELL